MYGPWNGMNNVCVQVELTMLLKKCTTAFSLVRRREEDCWGEAARWPRKDPWQDKQRSSNCIYLFNTCSPDCMKHAFVCSVFMIEQIGMSSLSLMKVSTSCRIIALIFPNCCQISVTERKLSRWCFSDWWYTLNLIYANQYLMIL